MTTSTIFLLILSVIIAALVSFYQYLYQVKNNLKLNLFLAFLRFISISTLLLLLVNPVISRKKFEIVKTPLPIVIDNSQSIRELKQEVFAKEVALKITQNKKLNNKFEVQRFTFDSEFSGAGSLDFNGKQTNIFQVAQNLNQLYRSQNYPVVLLTDGNQTIGNDYVYGFRPNTTVYPLVLGDTTTFLDLKINQLNVNKYAFFKNKFPVEVFLQYNGHKNIATTFAIQQGTATIYKQNIKFSPTQKTQLLSILLPADKVGLQLFNATLTSSEKEKNIYNNSKKFAVEVIDQRTEIALLYAINHPDLGVLKRAIESNKQRKVTLVSTKDFKSLQNYNVLILYQPDASFKPIFEQNKQAQLNTWIITGLHTDFSLLTQYQNGLQFNVSKQTEAYLATYNSQFSLFSIPDIGFEQLPPLQHPLGTISVKENSTTLLGSKIRNIETSNPLLVFSESGLKRNAFLFGENIWKWRMESYLKNQSFEFFDHFTDKIIQYLASNSSKKALVVTHENFYNSGETIEIVAQYFNKNYEFDENAELTIQLKNKELNTVKTYDFLRGNNDYKLNLDGLSQGNYSFTVTEKNTKAQYFGSFQVLDFEIEKQFVNPDVNRLQQLASNSNGKVFHPNQVEQLIDLLTSSEQYKPVEKASIKQTPLIEWIWLLIILAVSLSVEWFVRKYNGLL